MDAKRLQITELALKNEIIQQRLRSIIALDNSFPTASLLEQIIEKALTLCGAEASVVEVALKVLQLLEEQLTSLMAQHPPRGAFGRFFHGLLKLFTGREK